MGFVGGLFKKHKYIKIVIGIMILSIIASTLFAGEASLFGNEAYLEDLIMRLGLWGPFALIGLTIVEAVIAPIPGITPVIGGAVYGIHGLLYVWIGNIIGSGIAFWLARYFGVSLVKKLAPKFDKQKYHRQMKRLWFLYFLPLTPVDVLNYALGLSKVRYRTFLAITSVGFIFSLGILTLIGDALINLIS